MSLNLWRLIGRRPATPGPDIAGAVDGFIDGVWQCWAMDRSNPGRTLTVTLVSAAGRSIQARADRYRADVHQAMPGHGYYGFRVPARLLAGQGLVRALVGDKVLRPMGAGKARP